MANARVEVTVPGKVLLAGEYSVLRGGKALSVTLERALTCQAQCSTGENRFWRVTSNLWATPQVVKPDADPVTEPLVQTVLQGACEWQLWGGDIQIASDLEVRFGIGSSSALRVGVLTAMKSLADHQEISPQDVVSLAHKGQLTSQSFASGYDIATQSLGGLVLFQNRANKNLAECASRIFPASLTENHRLALIVGGTGAPTQKTASSGIEWLSQQNLWETLLVENNLLVDLFVQYFAHPSEEKFQGILWQMARHRAFFRPSPTYPTQLIHDWDILPGYNHTWGIKPTGAGGEDGILWWGTATALTELHPFFQKKGLEILPLEIKKAYIPTVRYRSSEHVLHS